MIPNLKLQQELDLESFSTSQLSRRFRDLDPALYESIFQHLVQQIHQQFGVKKRNAAKPADKTQMDELIVQGHDALNVFDRGYVDYRKYDQYCRNGTRFVTRLKDNAVVTVVEEKPVEPDSSIVREAIVLLGNPATY